MSLANHQISFSRDPRRSGRSLRVMLVDDQWDMVQMLMASLRFEGHEVWGLYRAREVVDGVKHFDPDVLILDLALPDASGLQLAHEVRSRYGKARPMLIAISGVHKPGPDAAPFDHFLAKPFPIESLFELLDHAVPRQSPQA